MLSILDAEEEIFSFSLILDWLKFTSLKDFLLFLRDDDEVEEEMGILVEFLNFLELAMLLSFWLLMFEEESESWNLGFNFKGRKGIEIEFKLSDLGEERWALSLLQFESIVGEGFVLHDVVYIVVDSMDCTESFLGKDMYEDTVDVEEDAEIKEGREEEVEEWDIFV